MGKRMDTAEFRAGHYCFVVLETEFYPGKGYIACVVVEDEPGYHRTGRGDTEPWYWGHDFEEAEECARKRNEAIGLSQENVNRIVTSSFRASNKVRS